jgi:hypothetical protein
MGVEHVAPDHGALALGGCQVPDAAHVLEEDAVPTHDLGPPRRSALTQVVRFVAVGVEEARPEVGQVLRVEVCEQLVASRIGRRQAPAAIRLGQVRVGRQLEHALHVAE